MLDLHFGHHADEQRQVGFGVQDHIHEGTVEENIRRHAYIFFHPHARGCGSLGAGGRQFKGSFLHSLANMQEARTHFREICGVFQKCCGHTHIAEDGFQVHRILKFELG